MCGCGCEVRPLQIGGAHNCACGPKSGCARCVRATQKTVATHALLISFTVLKWDDWTRIWTIWNVDETTPDVLALMFENYCVMMLTRTFVSRHAKNLKIFNSYFFTIVKCSGTEPRKRNRKSFIHLFYL